MTRIDPPGAQPYTVGMAENDYKQEIARIDARCAQLREDIMQLEFQNKEEIAAALRRFDAWRERSEIWDERVTKKLDHIAKLVGITYEELDLVEEDVQRAGSELVRPREHSTLS